MITRSLKTTLTLILLCIVAFIATACGDDTTNGAEDMPVDSIDAMDTPGDLDTSTDTIDDTMDDSGDAPDHVDQTADGDDADTGDASDQDPMACEPGSTDPECLCESGPSAVARMKVADEMDAPWLANGVELPVGQQEVLLDGSLSVLDQPGSATWSWTVVESPEFANPALTAADEVEARFYADMPGRYVISLEVEDGTGEAACEPVLLELTLVVERDLYILMTWSTPSDMDEFDTGIGVGSDVDIHLLEPGGFWNDPVSGTDCHWNATNPDWGTEAAEDDPDLTRDDTDGYGPEVIEIEQVASTTGMNSFYDSPYQLGAYFYDDFEQFSPVFVRFHLFTRGDSAPSAVWPSSGNGVQLETADPEVSTLQGDFWVAGTIDWNDQGPVFTEGSGQVTTGFPQN